MRVNFQGYKGISLVGDRIGNPEGAAVILLHGGGQTRNSWQVTAEDIAQYGFDVVTIDLRGHGESEWSPDGDYTLDTLKEDLGCVIKTLGKKAILVGFSMGGIISLLTACDPVLKNVCSALIIVDIGLRPEQKGVDRILDFMHGNPEGFASLDDAVATIAAYQPYRERPVRAEGVKKNLRLGEDGRYYWHWDPSFVARRGDSSKIDEFYRRITDSASEITVPCLLIRGARSDIVSDASVREFLQFIPHAEYVNVSGASHMVTAERNTVFTRAVVSFLTKILDVKQGAGQNNEF